MASTLGPTRIPPSKRLFDLLITVPSIILLSPILLVVGILVWALQGRPLFFRQARPGYQGKIFTLVKFSTMRDLRGADGLLLPDAERITPIGRLLRATSLDELPELYCVLRGEMSLVGPRPLLIKYLPLYSPQQLRRHAVLPGITGWAQINGRNALTWQEKFNLDIWYVDHWSLWLDMKILLMTVGKVLRREGINAPGQATAPEFDGSN
jgi:lipopolysaccharide/colanic/teichoic acid biosynthesis glycosyltransferase